MDGDVTDQSLCFNDRGDGWHASHFVQTGACKCGCEKPCGLGEPSPIRSLQSRRFGDRAASQMSHAGNLS